LKAKKIRYPRREQEGKREGKKKKQERATPTGKKVADTTNGREGKNGG
jgi:hypothetical protein